MEKYKWEYIGNNNKFKLYEKCVITQSVTTHCISVWEESRIVLSCLNRILELSVRILATDIRIKNFINMINHIVYLFVYIKYTNLINRRIVIPGISLNSECTDY